MFGNPISAILKRATRHQNDPINVITWMTHERYEPNLCRLNADFYAIPGQSVRVWNEQFAKIPTNYHVVTDRIPENITFDCIITQNPFVHIPLAIPISKQLHIPILNIFHTDAPLGWSPDALKQHNELFKHCSHHIFITDYNRISWGFEEHTNTSVIEHGIDTELFRPSDATPADAILSVVNDWVNRDAECGFKLWQIITNKLPVKVVGNTPGLSVPSQTLQNLVETIQGCRVFLNTSLRSPMPMSLIEGLACGLGVVTTNTNSICDFLTHGHDSLIFSPNEPEKGREYVIKLLQDKDLCKKLGQNAVETVKRRFGMDRFLAQWTELWETQVKKPFLG